MMRNAEQRQAERDPALALLMAQLGMLGEGAPGAEEKTHMLQACRGQSPELSAHLDRHLVEELTRLRQGLYMAQEAQSNLRTLLEQLTATPWHPATFLGAAETERGESALVLHGNARRVVSVAEEVDLDALTVGDEVLLAHELNVLMSKSPYRDGRSGEVAAFNRYTADRRLVLTQREEEIVVDPAGWLANIELRNGDQVRFDRAAWLALEKIERPDGAELFLEETPAETFADVGGLDRQIADLQRSIRLHFYHPETVRKYGVARKKAILVAGPPGTGKTLLARGLANWLAQLSRSGRSRFMNIRPGELHSMWYSVSEQNYRRAFRLARESGEREPEIPIVMFFDEVDAIGAARGDSVHRIDDKVLNAFMAELNGLEPRGNIVVMAATNRLDSLDPALVRPGRLGDLVLRIPRPNRKAAREIFFRHLGPAVPYAGDREAMVEAAVSRLYAPNADCELATLTFRDGKRRAVRAGDLISGAEIAKIAQAALERACQRELEQDRAGVELGDLLAGVAEFLESAARMLTPLNSRKYLDDLPQDLDVVRVDPVERKVAQPHRYLNVA